jgi:hypothetical protein
MVDSWIFLEIKVFWFFGPIEDLGGRMAVRKRQRSSRHKLEYQVTASGQTPYDCRRQFSACLLREDNELYALPCLIRVFMVRRWHFPLATASTIIGITRVVAVEKRPFLFPQ